STHQHCPCARLLCSADIARISLIAQASALLGIRATGRQTAFGEPNRSSPSWFGESRHGTARSLPLRSRPTLATDLLWDREHHDLTLQSVAPGRRSDEGPITWPAYRREAQTAHRRPR